MNVTITPYFPLQNAKVDHSKAIKEYSGSAADKVGDSEFL
jgi:hypothetical protein